MGVLDDKVAIVTGSARGIGRATAELLSEQGAKVLINDLDGDVAEQTASEIAGETVVYGGDLTKEGTADELVQTAIDAWGKIDIIVNNAGYTIDAPIHKMSDDAFQRMLDIHTIVPFRVIRAAAPHLREPAKKEREEGVEVFRKIVNVSSISGTMGNAGQANYSAGKAGVVGLTKTLAKEWGQFKINVNAVAFGYIETRLTASKDADNVMEIGGEKVQLGIPDNLRGMASMLIPLGRPGTPAGGGRRRLLPLLAVVQLRPRPGAQHHRRAVHGHDDVSTEHVISVVGEADLEDLLPLLRGYCDFYEVAPSDDALLAVSRALIADPEREGMQLIARAAGRQGGRLRDPVLDVADPQRRAARRHERPVRGGGGARHRPRRPPDRRLPRALRHPRRARARVADRQGQLPGAEGLRPHRRLEVRVAGLLSARRMRVVKPSEVDRDVPRGVVGGTEISQATTGAVNIYMGLFRVAARRPLAPPLPRGLRERGLHALRRARGALGRPARGDRDDRAGRHGLRAAARDAHPRQPLRLRAGGVRRRARLADRGLGRGPVGGELKLRH